MDNKITKSRFNNLMSYEWVVMIVVVAIGIFVFELIYAFFGVALTTGQQFKYLYDIRIDSSLDDAFLEALASEETETRQTFSYDVLSIAGEIVSDEANTLNIRIQTQDADVIFTDSVEEEGKSVRAKSLIDAGPIYSFEALLSDGKEYLKTFLKDEYLTLSPEEQGEKALDKDNLSTDKIDQAFLQRMKKDNRFRSTEQREDGKALERERIFQLCKELSDFSYLLQVGDEYGLFYKYTRHTQRLEFATSEENKELYQGWIDQEKEARYGLNVANLPNGKHLPSDVFKLAGSADAKGVVLMVFNFLSYQSELQFETVSFINSIVRSCSNLYDNL